METATPTGEMASRPAAERDTPKETGTGGASRLSEFIEHHHGQILEEFVAFAATLLPWAKGLSEEALQDHAKELLSAVVADMEKPQSGQQQSDKSMGHGAYGRLGSVGHEHAMERLKSGFKLDQLVAEYRALRASVLRLWGEALGDKQGAMMRFNEAIDESLAEAAVWYAEEINRTREQFLAILGHDLRNPLSAILIGATSLTKSKNIDDRQLRVATRIQNSAGRMTRMVNDLLDLTRTRLGAGIPVTLRPMELMPVCHQVIAELEAIHPDCELRLDASGSLSGEWDHDRLTQMLSNLVANALQHGCKGGGPVTVRAREQGDEVVLQVHNGGTPIPANALERIFDPMVREPTQTDKNVGGLGLGLYIARQIVTAHGGTLEVASNAREGTTFTARLPRRAVKKSIQGESA